MSLRARWGRAAPGCADLRRRLSQHFGRFAALAALTLFLLVLVVPAGARLNAQELSERSVRALMERAWLILPKRFTAPNGKVIEVDKSNRAAVEVPVDVARRVIKVGYLSARAQMCNLPNAQSANYRALMQSEARSKRWTDQQLLYISQLHLYTVMLMTGNVQIKVKDGKKEVIIKPKSSSAEYKSCSEEDKKKVFEKIKAYVCKVNAKKTVGCK